MLNVLEYIKQNYVSHFKDLEIERTMYFEQKVIDMNEEQPQLYLLCGSGGLDSYLHFIKADFSRIASNLDSFKSSEGEQGVQRHSEVFQSFCQYIRPLCVNAFQDRCRDKLNHIFISKFKLDKSFNDLLLEICKTEIKYSFIERIMGSGFDTISSEDEQVSAAEMEVAFY